MLKIKKVTILIPCYNEESGIGAVIDGFKAVEQQAVGYEFNIVVVDNNSKDATTEVAKSHGAKVFFEAKKGKGNAMRFGFSQISTDADFVVMIDGDNTYRPSEVMRLIEPLESGFCSVVLGSRLYGRMNQGSMKLLNYLGNKLFTTLARTFYGVQATDVLTGYYAWNAATARNLAPHLVSDGFTIEIEMVAKMAKLGEEIFSVPVSYDARAGETNLKPVEDGIKIMRVLLSHLFWNPATKIERITPIEIDELVTQ
jgi:glycosyltransferase involved in cell wall biosynthesis